MPPECPFCGHTYSVNCCSAGAAKATGVQTMTATFKRSPESCYFVYGLDGGGAPKRPHGTYEEAEKEAQRLANQHPGQQFIVLAPVAVASVAVSPVMVRLLPEKK